MGFKFSGRLERTLLGFAKAVIVGGALLYSTSPGIAQKYVGNQYLAFEEREGTRYRTVLNMKGNKTLSVFTKKGDDSLEVTFEVNEPMQDSSGRKKDLLYLTPLNQGFSRLVIFYPKGSKISRIEQEAYFLPQDKFVKLTPLIESRSAKKILKIGETLLGSITPWFGINPIKDAGDNLIDSSKEQDKTMHSQLSKRWEMEFGTPYSFEDVEFFQAEGIRGNERIRKIKTFFDVGELGGRGNFRAWIRPAAGTQNSEMDIKEWLGIDFSMQGGKLPAWIKKQEIGAESIPNSEYLIRTLQARETRDIGVYDPQRKKTIVYSFDEEEFTKLPPNEKKLQKEKELFLSIEKDLEKERLSEQTIVISEFGGRIGQSTIQSFREDCKSYKER